MKTMRTRLIACLLVCAFGVACSGCGKNSSSQNEDSNAENSGAETTFNSEQLAAMEQQPMQFSYSVDSEDSKVDVPVNQNVSGGNENSQGNSDGNSGDNYVVVTDTAGQPVVDENGNTVTEVANSSGGNNSETSTGGDDSSSGDASGNQGGDTYSESITSFQAYWMDMSKGEDYVFNGDFLDVTFKIKENAPDGVYSLTSGDCDFANWDAESVSCNFVDGAIAVGDGVTAPSAGSAQSGAFSIVAGVAQGKQGDEVTVRFDMSDNPGLVALIFRFKYDQNALEIVNAEVGADCSDYITVSQ